MKVASQRALALRALVTLASSTACGSGGQTSGASTLAARAEASPPALAQAAPRPPAERAPIRAPGPAPAPAPAPANDAEAKPPRDMRPRMGAVRSNAYIYKRPAQTGLALGYVRMGTSVPLKSVDPVPGPGCPKGYYEVEPRGYLCLDRKTTLDLDDPYFQALAEEAPKRGAVWPYAYAYSLGAPVYSRVPSPEEWERHERRYGEPNRFVTLGEWAKGHEELVLEKNPEATGPAPAIFAGGTRNVEGGDKNSAVLVWGKIPNGSMFSYSRAFEMHGRVWLVQPDLTLVPADRTRAQKLSTFKGVMLEGDVRLPLAWNREKSPIHKYARGPDGAFSPAGEVPPKSWAMVTGEKIRDGKRTWLPLRGEEGLFLALDEVTTTEPRSALPRGVKPGSKWIEVKIARGTLTVYEDLRPVRATLFSPGKGGVPPAGRSNADHEKYATTKPGFFPIAWKDHAATMSPDDGPPTTLFMTDVPHIQYLQAPLAMHVAFWHEDFGNKKSAECVNVSPEDGAWLFEYTDPPVPEGWAGIRPGDGNGPSTPVVITGY